MGSPFSFTKSLKTMKIEDIQNKLMPEDSQSLIPSKPLLFDLKTDPKQLKPIYNPKIEQKMRKLMSRWMLENDAPLEQYSRIGLPIPDLD